MSIVVWGLYVDINCCVIAQLARLLCIIYRDAQCKNLLRGQVGSDICNLSCVSVLVF